MPDLVEVHAIVENFRRDLLEKLQSFLDEIEREVYEKARKRVLYEREREIKEIAKLATLKQGNVKDYLRILKAVEEIESKRGIDQGFKNELASKYGLYNFQVELLIELVRIGRIYKMLKENKEKVLDYLEI